MALRFFYRSEIRRHFFRLHHNFTQKQHTRTDDFTDDAHQAYDGMNLRKVPAGRIDFFPDIRHGIQPDNIDAPVCQIQEVIHHFVEYPRVFIIQIPLIRVKRRHNKMIDVRKICKIPRRRCRKYLRNRMFIQRRQIRIFKEKIPAHIFAVFFSCFFRPRMIFRRMVHYKIHTDADPFFMTGIRQSFQIFH